MGEEKTANQAAILATIKLIVDGVKDAEKALAPGQTLLDKLKDFENLIPDAVEEFKQFGDLKAELALLQPSDIPALAAVMVADMDLQDPHAKAICEAILKLLGDAANGLVADITALVHAFQQAPNPNQGAGEPAVPPSGG